MKYKLSKLMLIISILLFSLLVSIKVFAASMGLSINKTSGYVGDTFTVTISGINGRVNISGNSNVTISPSGSQWVDGSLTITGSAKSVGTGTVTVTPVDVSTTSAEPEEVTASASRSITIKQKEEPKQETTQTTPTTNTNSSSNNSTNNSSNTSSKSTTTTTNKKTNSTNKTNTTKNEETVQNQYVEDQGTISEFGITSLYVHAVNENEEKNEIEISPRFDINTSEYTCNVTENIKKVEIIYEANEYKDLIKIEGLENELITGENVITIKMNDNNGKEKVYKITVIKEEPKVVETIAEETTLEKVIKEENNEEKWIIKMPVIWFIILQLGILVINVLVSLIVYKAKKTNG